MMTHTFACKMSCFSLMLPVSSDAGKGLGEAGEGVAMVRSLREHLGVGRGGLLQAQCCPQGPQRQAHTRLTGT